MFFDIIENKIDDNFVFLVGQDGILTDNAYYYTKEELKYFNYILEDFLSVIENSGIIKQIKENEIIEIDRIKIKNDKRFSNKFLLILFSEKFFNTGYWVSIQDLISIKFKIDKCFGLIEEND